MLTKTVVFKDNNKKQNEFINAVLSKKYTTLVYGGAIRGGKTYVGIALLIILCKLFPRSRWAIVRKDLKRLKENTRPALNKFIEGAGVKINESAQIFSFKNGSKIIFKGENFDRDKTLESFKGLEVNGFLLEEISEIKEATYNKCIERAGAYIIQPTPAPGQPPPLIICTCNPTQGWVKEKFYNKWKKGNLPPKTFYLPAFVTDNPNLPKSYLDNLKTLPRYEYEVFVLGNWDITLKTPNSFWHAIDVNKHIKPEFYNPSTTIHISIDANVMPYCTATIWQIYPAEKKIIQIDEICARTPYNHAAGLGRLVIEYLKKIDYSDTVFLYGDASTKNQNSIDEKKRSFFQIFTEEVQKDYHTIDEIASHNPQISSTGEFVNAIYEGFEGWQIVISEICKESISDYLSVKRDMDGTMQKKKITDENGSSYEEYGHLSDTKRYFVYRCLSDLYYTWKNRFTGKVEPIVLDVGFKDIF